MLSLLETYIWAPLKLSAFERSEIDALLAKSPHAREYVELLDDMRSYIKDDASQIPDAVRDFAHSLYTPPRRIRLERKPAATTDPRTSLSARTSFAAAATASTSRFRTLGTMLNREQGILVRFLHDLEEDVVRGYILCNQESLTQQMVAVFDGGEKVYCPDSHGVFRMDAKELGDVARLGNHTIDLLLPTATASVPADAEGVFAVGETVEITASGKTLALRYARKTNGFVTFQTASTQSAHVVPEDTDLQRPEQMDAIVRCYSLD